jgi:hypothetical protein
VVIEGFYSFLWGILLLAFEFEVAIQPNSNTHYANLGKAGSISLGAKLDINK